MINPALTWEDCIGIRAALLEARDHFDVGFKNYERYDLIEKKIASAMHAALHFDDADVPALLRKQA